MYDAFVAELPDDKRARLYECALKGPDGVNVALVGFGPDGYGPEQWPLPIRVPMLDELSMSFKLTGIPGEPDAALYVLLTPKALPLDQIANLRTAKPALTMTKADLAAALVGKDVTKILVLPPQDGEPAVKPALEVVTSADLDPNADLVLAASRRGTIVATLLISKNAPPPPFAPPVGDDLPLAQIAFSGIEGMAIQWDVTAPGKFDSDPLVVPGRFNFPIGNIYRLKLSRIPGREGLEVYPTLELAPPLPRTEAYLEHNAIPIELTAEDIDHVLKSKWLTKVVYLPDPAEKSEPQKSVETLVSSRLPSDLDPILEADRRGAILAIVRLGTKPKPVIKKPNSSVMPEVDGAER